MPLPRLRYIYTDLFILIRGCSYGGVLVWLDGLAHLSEILPSFTLIKIKCVHMTSEPACIGEISLNFAGESRLGEMKIFEPGEVG